MVNPGNILGELVMRKTLNEWAIAALLLLGGCGGGSGGADVPSVATPQAVATSTPVAVVPAVTVTPSPMVMGVATAFDQQGWDYSILDTARSIGATTLRDEVQWKNIETTPGVYQFGTSGGSYLDTLTQKGFSVTLLMTDSNPLYDGGNTVYTDVGRAAYARYVVATLNRFPGVKAIEISNEYNAWNFVSGPVRDEGYGPRQKYYFDMLRTVYQAVKASRPDVKVLGGAALSIPVGYFKPLFDLGALNYMDGLVVHPYTTEPEQFEKQIAILRTAMGSTPRPIHVTEFAQELDSVADTANYLVKSVAVMATAGIAEADWYALRQQGPANNIWYKNVALASFSGQILPPGQAYKVLSQQVLSKGASTRVAIDDFTYAYQFGTNAMVIWGEPRSLAVTAAAKFYNAQGLEIAQPSMISTGSPIIIVSDVPLAYGSNVMLGATQLVADSFDQFDYSNDLSGPAKFEGPWSYYAYSVHDQRLDPMYTQGGGEISSSSWTPHIGSDWLRPFNISAGQLNPVDFGTADAANVFKAVLRYTSSYSGNFTISGPWDVTSTSVDGVDLTIQVNGQSVFSTTFNGHYDMSIKNVALKVGDVVSIIVGTNKTVTGGDSTRFRVRIHKA
jgi:hypothetical protein